MNIYFNKTKLKYARIGLWECAKSIPILILAGIVCFTPFFHVFAQESLDLQSYLNQIEEEAPSQNDLPVATPQTQDQSDNQTEGVFGEIFSELADVIPFSEEEEQTEQAIDNQDDVLPTIPNLNTRSTQAGMNLPIANETPLSMNNLGLNALTPEQLEEQIRSEAFDAAITGLFPLSVDNIRTLLRKNENIEKAVQAPISGIPVPQINVETISLDPGVAPLKINTAAGFITTVNILDVTGAPWPIQDVSWAGDYEVIEPEAGGHVLRITPLTKVAYGNMSLRLLTLKTPVTIQLETNSETVQYRLDVRVPEYGPFAEAPLIEGTTQRVAGDPNIMSVLDGVAPNSAEKLYVSGVDGRTSAFKMNNMTYIRTPLTLISPSWDQSVSSADGMNVYAMRETPIVLLSDKGRLSRVNLTLTRDTEDE